ncbi:uncharacterized protein LOC115632718 [Scaptodrosophila lebanonensis]|uniref:Uncharacterized protein LOC115632718 n=1 Tax=Drosophila lebanonensis TaxID=7225 RepID=A0A6J2UEH6_DROLE|nr:uncharacterized protein LOC115632718 [Scaptodrosophila lebanonensis]
MKCSPLLPALLMLLGGGGYVQGQKLPGARSNGAYVYMELNGHKYSYDTSVPLQTNDLSGNYDYQQQLEAQPIQSPQSYVEEGVVGSPTNDLDAFSPQSFVQQSLRRMRSQPLRFSYSTRQGQMGQEANLGATLAPQPGSVYQPRSGTVPIYSNPPSYNFDFNTPHMSHAQSSDAAGNVVGKYSYYDAAGYHELSYKAGDGIGFVVMDGNLAKSSEQTALPIEDYSDSYDNVLTAASNLNDLRKYRRFA